MNRYLYTILLFVVALFASFSLCTYAQEPHSGGRGINWSLNISHQKDSLRTTYANMGLLTNIQAQKGVGLNLVSSIVRQEMRGVQIAGVMNYTGREACGMQIGGLSNIARYDMDGLMIGGLMNSCGGTFRGAQMSLLCNVGVDIRGVQYALICNIAAQQIRGVQLSGVVNIAVNTDRALQLSSLSNVCLGNMKGVQFSLGNYAENVRGAQIGMFNISTGQVDGWQIGIINHSKDTTGHKLGLVNINPRTKIQAMFFGGNTSKINAAIRFKNRLNYNILGIGTHYLDLNDKFSGCLFYRTGLYMPLCRRLELSSDLGYYHIENFENSDVEIPERMYSLQGRVNLEYKPWKKLAFIASTGYSMTRYYKKNKFFRKEAIVELGIVLF